MQSILLGEDAVATRKHGKGQVGQREWESGGSKFRQYERKRFSGPRPGPGFRLVFYYLTY